MGKTRTIFTQADINDAYKVMASGTFSTRPFVDRSRFLLTYGYLFAAVYNGDEAISDLRYKMHNYILGISQTWSK